jgi:hypothetical protein
MPNATIEKKDNITTEGNVAAKAVVGRLYKLDRKAKENISFSGRKVKKHFQKTFRTKRSNWFITRKILGLTTDNIPTHVRLVQLRKSAILNTPQQAASAVVKIIEEKNPFATKEGAPKFGKEIQFFEWAEKNWNTHLESLPSEEREKHIEAAITLSEKMNT